MSSVPIADHALLSDCHSAALVTRDGSVDWLCLPRFDSPAVLGRLLDGAAGHWSIRPAGRYQVTRCYLEDTMVLETTFRGETGTMVLTDALALGKARTAHQLGVGAPHLLVRSVACAAGEVAVEVDYAPRPEYGLVVPIMRAVDGGVTARGGAESLVLSTPVPLCVTEGTARGTVALRAGETLWFGLQRAALGQPAAPVRTPKQLAKSLTTTVKAWRTWSAAHQTYDGPWRHLVRHSGRVLQALTFQPTGAIVAAATTSLPESVGGERNWDYRYSWVRDASLTMEALWITACPHEAGEFFDYMATAAATGTPDAPLQVMFGVGGERDLTERQLPHLAGWRGSRPVRVGNGAWRQEQVDVYGALLAAAHRLAEQLGTPQEDTRVFLTRLADAAADRWRLADQGIWELRGEPRHFVHSKVMCWVALDRAVRLADRLAAHDRVPAWTKARDEIAAAVLTEGWSDEVGAFTQSFGSTALDAATLVLPIVGFLPPDDPRVLATLDAVEEQLTDSRGLVYRYCGDDGLTGDEGTFLLCTFWLAHALALAGRVDRAAAVFARAVSHVNDVGLLAEEVDPATGELLGNFPQAFSHIGLVNAAWAIGEAARPAAG